MSSRTRRGFLRTAAGAAAACGHAAWSQEGAPLFVYFGSYTTGDHRGEGIYIYRMDAISGAMELVNTVTGVVNPSFLALDPAGRYLYACNETGNYAGLRSGSVSAFAVHRETGDLTFLNSQATMGQNPAHLSVDPTGRFVLAANYSGGNIVLFRIQPDGSLAEASDVVQQTGELGPDPARQEASHPHQIVTDPTGSFAIVTDLGLDKTSVYRIDGANAKLILNSETAAAPGAGPRHLAYHPLGRWLYRINELNNTMTAMEWLPVTGELKEIHSLPTLPEGFSGANTTAEVVVAPYGIHVYGSNRGENSIVQFDMEASTGEMTFIASAPSRGEAPRNFGIDPDGNFLLAANQNSSNVVQFRIDRQSGRLTPTGVDLPVGTPVNVTFLSRRVGVDAKPGVTLSIFTNPAYITDGTTNVRSSIAWNAPAAKEVELRIGAPDGALLGRFANAGGATTDKWVSDGLTFYLQDVSDGKALTAQNTLGTVNVVVRTQV